MVSVIGIGNGKGSSARGGERALGGSGTPRARLRTSLEFASAGIPLGGILVAVTKGEIMTIQTYQIAGMTCGHCEMSVREEIGEIHGVSSVTASHESGTAVVESETTLDVNAVRAAVEEAGYELVDAE